MPYPFKLSPWDKIRVYIGSKVIGKDLWRRFLIWNATQPDICFVCRRERKSDSWKGPVKKS